jgi:hypothetical protein
MALARRTARHLTLGDRLRPMWHKNFRPILNTASDNVRPIYDSSSTLPQLGLWARLAGGLRHQGSTRAPSSRAKLHQPRPDCRSPGWGGPGVAVVLAVSSDFGAGRRSRSPSRPDRRPPRPAEDWPVQHRPPTPHSTGGNRDSLGSGSSVARHRASSATAWLRRVSSRASSASSPSRGRPMITTTSSQVTTLASCDWWSAARVHVAVQVHLRCDSGIVSPHAPCFLPAIQPRSLAAAAEAVETPTSGSNRPQPMGEQRE